TYSGTTTLNAGYLNASADNALGVGTNSDANGTVVNSGATLILGDVFIASERVVLNGPGKSSAGVLQTAGVATWGGDIVLNTPAVFNLAGGPLTVNGKITGPGDLAFGRNTLTLVNLLNDWAGSTTIGNPAGGPHVLRLAVSNVIPNTSAVNILDHG